MLKDGGYHTYIAGKWHLGSSIELRRTPDAWGFERSYTLLGGATSSHFGPESAGSHNYAADGQYVQPGQPGQPGGYDTDFYTDKLIAFIDSNQGDGKPFAAFATYTSPHWPLQAPDSYLNRYAGWYGVGYDVIRARRLLRQRALGIIPPGFEANPGLPNALTASQATPNNNTPDARYVNADNPNPPDGDPSYVDYGPGRVNKKWSSLTADEKRLQTRYMEIYAAMVENLDYNVGRLIQHLKDLGEYDNTLIIFHSDNGAEGWPLADGQEATNLRNFANLGKSGSNVQYGLRWAEVSATPLKLLKGFTAEGGTSVPAIVHLPGQARQLPILREFIHVRDSAATLLEAAGIAPPTTPAPPAIDAQGVDQNAGKVVYNGRNVYPITGLSYLAVVEGRQSGPLHTEPVGDEQYGRGYLVKGRWKALFVEPPWGPTDGHWQLYDIVRDRGEVHDLAGLYPNVVYELKQDWDEYLHSVGGVEPLRPKGYY